MKLRSGKVLRNRSPRVHDSVKNVMTTPSDTTLDVKNVVPTQTCTRRVSPRNHSSSTPSVSTTHVTPRSTHSMKLRSGKMMRV